MRSKKCVLKLSSVILSLLLTVPFSLRADEPDEEEEAHYPKIKISGLLDFRAVVSQKDANWSACPDGTGMGCMTTPSGATRYGGNGNNGKTFFDLSQLTLDMDAEISSRLSLHNQFNVDVQTEGPSRFGTGALSVIEAYLKLKHAPVKNGTLRLGVFAPPFSRENAGPNWSTRFTITPSAINTWIATLIRVYGLEANVPLKDTGFTLSAGLFSGADEGNPKGPGAAKDLIFRGWLMHDYWMPVSAVSSEIDGKPGFYGKLKYNDPSDRFDIDLGYYDNNGDVLSSIGQDVWGTKFFNAGLRVDVTGNFRLLGQYLAGVTSDWKDADKAVIRCEYKSSYLMGLVVLREKGIHFAARYDDYKVNRYDPSFLLRNEGYAWTFASGKQLGEKESLLLEYLMMNDKARVSVQGDVADDLIQLSYKLRF